MAATPGNDNALSKSSAAWELGKLQAVAARAKGRDSLDKDSGSIRFGRWICRTG
jgi:hypothetical protein